MVEASQAQHSTSGRFSRSRWLQAGILTRQKLSSVPPQGRSSPLWFAVTHFTSTRSLAPVRPERRFTTGSAGTCIAARLRAAQSDGSDEVSFPPFVNLASTLHSRVPACTAQTASRSGLRGLLDRSPRRGHPKQRRSSRTMLNADRELPSVWRQPPKSPSHKQSLLLALSQSCTSPFGSRTAGTLMAALLVAHPLT